MTDFPTHDEIEAMRDDGSVPDVFVDWAHRERERLNKLAALRFWILIQEDPEQGDTGYPSPNGPGCVRCGGDAHGGGAA